MTLPLTPEEAYATLPKQIKVGPHTYKIVVVDAIDGGNNVGECDEGRLTISLSAGLASASVIAGTLWHECLHAIWYDRNLGKRPKEEDIILTFENGCLQLIQDNPRAISWIIRCLKAGKKRK